VKENKGEGELSLKENEGGKLGEEENAGDEKYRVKQKNRH